MPDHSTVPDYQLDDVLLLESAAQFKAYGHPVRMAILGLLREHAASITGLATALDLSKGTVGSHVTVLRGAGLIRVVRTRQVRAMTEKFYGRVARNFEMQHVPGGPSAAALVVRGALGERAGGDEVDDFLMVHASLARDDVDRFVSRLEALTAEFTENSRPGQPVYGLITGIYRTSWSNPQPEEETHEHTRGPV